MIIVISDVFSVDQLLSIVINFNNACACVRIFLDVAYTVNESLYLQGIHLIVCNWLRDLAR